MGGPGTAEAQLPLLYQISYLHTPVIIIHFACRERERASFIIFSVRIRGSSSRDAAVKRYQTSAMETERTMPERKCGAHSVAFGVGSFCLSALSP